MIGALKGVLALLLAASLVSVSVSGASAADVSQAVFVQTGVSQGSWALGLVAPQGIPLAGGGTLDWASVRNVTATVQLPSMNHTDNTVLIVLSVMASNDSVLQVSAGLFPGSSAWRAVGWYIPDIDAVPQVYYWVLNATQPDLPPGSVIRMSILMVNGTWGYRFTDTSKGAAFAGIFASTAAGPLRRGDQEVFALESYTSSVDVLSEMGNVTLRSLQVDGRQTEGGTYYLGDWDPSHDPLFVVGGLAVPAPVSVWNLHNGTLIWGYSDRWGGFGDVIPELSTVALTLLIGVPLACLSVAIVLWRVRAKQGAPATASG